MLCPTQTHRNCPRWCVVRKISHHLPPQSLQFHQRTPLRKPDLKYLGITLQSAISSPSPLLLFTSCSQFPTPPLPLPHFLPFVTYTLMTPLYTSLPEAESIRHFFKHSSPFPLVYERCYFAVLRRSSNLPFPPLLSVNLYSMKNYTLYPSPIQTPYRLVFLLSWARPFSFSSFLPCHPLTWAFCVFPGSHNHPTCNHLQLTTRFSFNTYSSVIMSK